MAVSLICFHLNLLSRKPDVIDNHTRFKHKF